MIKLILIMIFIVITGFFIKKQTVSFWVKNTEIYIDDKKVSNGDKWIMVTFTRGG